MKSLQERQQKVTEGILKAFKARYPHLMPQSDFETIWPASKWDMIHTETRSFDIELNYKTGKVINIQEFI